MAWGLFTLNSLSRQITNQLNIKQNIDFAVLRLLQCHTYFVHAKIVSAHWVRVRDVYVTFPQKSRLLFFYVIFSFCYRYDYVMLILFINYLEAHARNETPRFIPRSKPVYCK